MLLALSINNNPIIQYIDLLPKFIDTPNSYICQSALARASNPRQGFCMTLVSSWLVCHSASLESEPMTAQKKLKRGSDRLCLPFLCRPGDDLSGAGIGVIRAFFLDFLSQFPSPNSIVHEGRISGGPVHAAFTPYNEQVL